ncbi:MAG: phage late control D family protein [Pseudomonadota bacterium]|nr:phage late control D family protein [Pseudomonadota bacterium]
MGYPIPAWQVVMDGRDLTERMRPRLIDLTLTEARGKEADQLDLRIHDNDGRIALPARGVEIHAAIGWQDSGLIDKGIFVVDEVEYSGSPDIITIRARAADLTQPMRRRRERSWHGSTVGAILGDIAAEHGLKASIDGALAGIAISHFDQTGESDANIITRLAERYDAVGTVKAKTLVFKPIGNGVTASGIILPDARIVRADGDQHRYSAIDRDGDYSGVQAGWTDKSGASRQVVTVGSAKNAKQLKTTYNNEAEAREHATAEQNRIKRGAAKFDYTLALGRPDLYPEQRITITGFKPEIDNAKWLIKKVTHTITGSGGYITALEMETAV